MVIVVTYEVCHHPLATNCLGPMLKAPETTANVVPTVVNLTWNCNRDRIAPDPREGPEHTVARMPITNRP
jgi:hypothetical protein